MQSLIRKLEALLEKGGTKKDVALLIISGAALLLSIFKPFPLPFDPAWVAIILCGVPIILEAVIGLITAFDIKADVLVSLALIASVCIGEDFAAGEVAFIMQLGALLEDLTVARARAGIEKLVKLTPQTARVLTAQGESIIAAQDVQAGAMLRVLPGETIPVDGVITAGQTTVNQAVMTGEPLPVDKGPGDSVSSGTVNQYGAFEMRAEKAGEDSSIQRMIRLVQSADAGKAKIVGLADRWATWIVVTALTAAALTWIFSGQIIRAVTILVVFCPCALVLATPTAIMAAIGNATRHGFLVREGDALERLARVNEIAFDKTGTLTKGEPVVTVIGTLPGFERDALFRLAAAAESLSEHPLGKAVVRSYRAQSGDTLPAASDFTLYPGQGIVAQTDGHRIWAGNAALMERAQTPLSPALSQSAEACLNRGATLIYLSVDGEPAGFMALEDTLRPASAGMIAGIKQLAVKPLLLTGDSAKAARAIAGKLDIQEVCPGCLPEDKLRRIRQDQQSGCSVCMIGDGINDAPALKCAGVGIAMGGVGSDIAVDAADIVLVKDEVEELPHLLALSQHMMTVIKLNLTFSMTLNFLAIALAITGKLSPVVGALVHNAGSVLVILNSALLLKWRKKQ